MRAAAGAGKAREEASSALGRPSGAVALAGPDAPFAVDAGPAPAPSLLTMTGKAAEDVIKRRGAQHTPGQSTGERLATTLKRGIGEMDVQRNGFWDGYFTGLRKALLAAWSGEKAQAQFGHKATVRIRLVLDAEGELRDFELVLRSGSPTMDTEVEQALHQTTQFPAPPEHVLHGKTELVSEWELSVHPGLAPQMGEPVFGQGLGVGLSFDMLALANPRVDLKPLERNVVLASYWTQ
jgi:TonB family protein